MTLEADAIRGGRELDWRNSCALSPSDKLVYSIHADRTHVLELGSAATVADVKAAIEARQGESQGPSPVGDVGVDTFSTINL